jgi:DNA mismatch endonuclease, patch repair protein
MDSLTVEQRRRVMSKNRGRTEVERVLARELWRRGFRYLSADGYKARFGTRLTGNPDIIFTGIRLVVFVDGCFWHGCPRCHRLPQSNRKFWEKKFSANVTRDRSVSRKLRRHGWAVVRVREHALRPGTITKTVLRLVAMLAEKTR